MGHLWTARPSRAVIFLFVSSNLVNFSFSFHSIKLQSGTAEEGASAGPRLPRRRVLDAAGPRPHHPQRGRCRPASSVTAHMLLEMPSARVLEGAAGPCPPRRQVLEDAADPRPLRGTPPMSIAARKQQSACAAEMLQRDKWQSAMARPNEPCCRPTSPNSHGAKTSQSGGGGVPFLPADINRYFLSNKVRARQRREGAFEYGRGWQSIERWRRVSLGDGLSRYPQLQKIDFL